ncbi:MAG: hypothetical protein MJ252_10955 [archaeon]|nr:hypothetical protein [archaeon]
MDNKSNKGNMKKSKKKKKEDPIEESPIIEESQKSNTNTNDTQENIKPANVKYFDGVDGNNIQIEKLKEGDITIKCWNCKGIHIARKDWRVMQCPICNAMNRLPGELNETEELLKYIKATNPISYKDTQNKIPLMHYLVLCPYCRTENKVRESAYHCICYRCKNRFPLGKKDGENPNTNEEEYEPPPKTPNEGMFYKYDIKTNRVYPPERVMRFSDMFFPDPMTYPGYYPINSLSPLYPDYSNPYNDLRFIQRQNTINTYCNNFNLSNLNRSIQSGKNIEPNRQRVKDMLNELNGKVDKLMGEGIYKNNTGQYYPEKSNGLSKVNSYAKVFFNNYNYKYK